MPDDPSVAATPAPFWKIALGATSVALVAGIWAIVVTFFDNPDSDNWIKLVLPLLMLLAGGFFFGHFSRRRRWLVSLFLIVPNPVVLISLAGLIVSLGDIRESTLIKLLAFVAAPLIGVGLALALTLFRR